VIGNKMQQMIAGSKPCAKNIAHTINTRFANMIRRQKMWFIVAGSSNSHGSTPNERQGELVRSLSRLIATNEDTSGTIPTSDSNRRRICFERLRVAGAKKQFFVDDSPREIQGLAVAPKPGGGRLRSTFSIESGVRARTKRLVPLVW
jgi:hypothetical protein